MEPVLNIPPEINKVKLCIRCLTCETNIVSTICRRCVEALAKYYPQIDGRYMGQYTEAGAKYLTIVPITDPAMLAIMPIPGDGNCGTTALWKAVHQGVQYSTAISTRDIRDTFAAL